MASFIMSCLVGAIGIGIYPAKTEKQKRALSAILQMSVYTGVSHSKYENQMNRPSRYNYWLGQKPLVTVLRKRGCESCNH